jgi:hypothetical protein
MGASIWNQPEIRHEHDYQDWRTDKVRKKSENATEDTIIWITENIIKIKFDLDEGKQDLICLLEQTYDAFIKIYQHKNERELHLTL